MTEASQDLEFVRRLIAGDEEAFEEFSERHIPALYRFASRRLQGNRELTREVVQSTLCNVMGKLGSFRGEAALLTWLCACCRNEIAGHYRREKRRAMDVEFDTVEEVSPGSLRLGPQESAEGALLRGETVDLVHRALDALPPRYGRALEWKYIDSLSVTEIAGRLEVGYKAAESLLTRARQAFKEEYNRSVAVLQRPVGGLQMMAGGMEVEP
ncbi:MAG: RNA polymerase sigma factor [Acidobacteria bacterium]|nr:RNA polymerase sigma factor [Acidobacteriota bacterium]